MRNPIWERTQLENEPYGLLSFLQLSYENIKKGALTIEFPMTMRLKCLLHNLIPSILFSQISLLYALIYYETSIILESRTLSPPRNPIFNITP